MIEDLIIFESIDYPRKSLGPFFICSTILLWVAGKDVQRNQLQVRTARKGVEGRVSSCMQRRIKMTFLAKMIISLVVVI